MTTCQVADMGKRSCLDPPCLELQAPCLASLGYDPPFPHLQDIIEHEYAIVESVPDEDRHALMPIIRFVRNTLQDPFAVQLHYATYNGNGQICNRGGSCHGSDRIKSCANHEIPEMHVRKASMMGMQCLLLPSKQATSALTSKDPCHYDLSFHTQKEVHNIVHNISSDVDGPSLDDYAAQFQTLKKFELNSVGHDKGQDEVYRLTTFTLRRAHESETIRQPSCTGFESFNLDEIWRSLRPHGDSDSYVDNGDDGEYGNGGDYGGDGDNEANEDCNDDESFLAYDTHYRSGSDTNVPWIARWGDEPCYVAEKSSGYTPLQFPKLHRRKRSVIKKAVGWVKRRSTLILASRVRQKRKCSLPCCTDCEPGTKRRKGTEYTSKKCAKRSKSKFPSPSNDDPEKKRHDDRKSKGMRADYINASGSQGLTACEATQRMVQHGHLEASGLEKQSLGGHVKTTLKECPEFTELRSYRYALRDLGKLQGHLGTVGDFRSQVKGELLYEESDDSLENMSLSQRGSPIRDDGCPQCLSIPDHGYPQCHNTGGEQGQCRHHAKPGSYSCEQHPQGIGNTEAKGTFCGYVRRDTGDCGTEHDMAVKEEMVDTDGKNWECCNQAKYWEHHQTCDKKGSRKSKRKFKKLEYITQDSIVSTLAGSLMQLRPTCRLQVF